MTSDKFILDVTCGNRSIWFQKNNKFTIFTDKREEILYFDRNAVWNVKPDLVVDFTAIPFPDNSFKLIVFDPPHLSKISPNAILAQKYGYLLPTWKADIANGFHECFRCLEPFGILIFKWSNFEIKADDILKLIPYKPLFGHTTGSKSKTIWLCFMKY